VFAVLTYLGVYGGEEYRSLEYALLIFNTGIVGGVDAEHVHSCVFGVRRHVEHICVQNQSKTMNPDTTLVGFVLYLTNDM